MAGAAAEAEGSDKVYTEVKAAFSRMSSVSVFSKNVIFLCLSGHVLSPFTPSKFKCHLCRVFQRGL